MAKPDKNTDSPAASSDNLCIDANSQSDIQLSLDNFLTQVGERVIAERQRLKMSRRVLSERSGVSQRTIVLLETGVGNISLALLYRIASALGHSVEWFMYTEDQTQKDARRVAAYYLTASPTQQQKIQNLLTPNELLAEKKQRICLIGLRGAGKSTLGKALSEKLSIPFIELNDEVETLCGMPTEELMGLYGTEGYRKLEHQALKKIIDHHDRLILAAAGGVVSEEINYTTLLQNFHTVWLKAKPEEHMERVKQQGDERPMAGNPAAMEELRSILISRESRYAEADVHIDTSNKTTASSLQDLNKVVVSLLT